jgi:hypothetical protein
MAPYGMGMACAPMGMTPQVPQGQGSGWGKVTLNPAGFHHFGSVFFMRLAARW